MLRFVPFALIAALALPLFQAVATDFDHPIDALSVEFTNEKDTARVSGWNGDEWTSWQDLAVENEHDPLLRESNLVLFDHPVTRIRFEGVSPLAVHPIRVSTDPVSYAVASHTSTDKPKILSRRDWGADESLLYMAQDVPETPVEQKGNGNGNGAEEAPSNRVKDCEEAQRLYPKEFKPTRTVSEGPDGKRLRWPQQYSENVKLLVVHHTALKVEGDTRPAVERIRALYQFHAENRGWGDIGYHYLVDEAGQIYQGRAGGANVIGGHAYCNNTGTIGVALLGNFDLEQPTAEQIQALQWLLDDLAKTYNIDPGQKVNHHGKLLQPIVGHRALVSTDCPGYYVWETLGQIRSNVVAGTLDAAVRFPKLAKKASSSSRASTRVVARRATEKITRRSATLSRKINRADRVSTRIPRATAGSSNIQKLRSNPIKRKSSNSSVSSDSSVSSGFIRIRVTKQEKNFSTCADADLAHIQKLYRGTVECLMVDGKPAIINEVSLEDYMAGLAEEPDTEPWEKQRAFAIAARTYAAFYRDSANRKFPGKPYDGSDDPAFFQAYGGIAFEKSNPRWVESVRDTEGLVLTKNNQIIKAPYFSTDDGRTRSPEEAGWKDFPFAEVFASKPDPWCAGQKLWGHGVGMSGCGAEGQAHEGKKAEEILEYYYPGTRIIDIEDISS